MLVAFAARVRSVASRLAVLTRLPVDSEYSAARRHVCALRDRPGASLPSLPSLPCALASQWQYTIASQCHAFETFHRIIRVCISRIESSRHARAMGVLRVITVADALAEAELSPARAAVVWVILRVCARTLLCAQECIRAGA